MECRIEHDWMRNALRVWLYQPGPNNMTVQVVGFDEGGHMLLQNFEQGLLPEPSFVMPRHALEALVKAASGVLSASDATVDALRDTREMRDRLLALVEKRH